MIALIGLFFFATAAAAALFAAGWLLRKVVCVMRRNPSTSLAILGALAISIAGAWAALQAGLIWSETHHRLAYVPDGLQVRDVAYANEEAQGIGPGANEAGILVYPLPAGIAARIEHEGVVFLDRLPDNTRPRSAAWQGRFEDWQRTPIVPDARWPAGTGRHRSLVYDYVCAYGVCIDIDAAILADATSALTETGNYVAYGRIGMLVVSPKRRRVYFLYSG